MMGLILSIAHLVLANLTLSIYYSYLLKWVHGLSIGFRTMHLKKKEKHFHPSIHPGEGGGG